MKQPHLKKDQYDLLLHLHYGYIHFLYLKLYCPLLLLWTLALFFFNWVYLTLSSLIGANSSRTDITKSLGQIDISIHFEFWPIKKY